MRFAFSDEQRAFQQAFRDLLRRECPPAVVRAAWGEGDGRSAALWRKLAEQGIPAVLAPEAQDGLGGSELDLVLLFEEAGRAALPEPLLETCVGVALLRDAAPDLAAHWLPRVAAGDARLAVRLGGQLHVADAHVAELLLVEHDGALHALKREAVELLPERSVDGARRLFRLTAPPPATSRIAAGEVARTALAAAADRAALLAAAELVGLGAQMIELTAAYAKVREQFGRPIGAFQAVGHHLADALLAVEFARPVVHAAAYAMARSEPDRALAVSMAKARASDAATIAARVALQCHGAIGYSFEHDLHLWMKRAWALAASFGDAAFHRARLARHLFDTP